jgi:FKBP-type peptidyl-prolyl cis-trans isomerase
MKYIVFFALIVSLVSCNQAVDISTREKRNSSRNDSLIKFNQEFLVIENQYIEDYIKRHSLQMQKTGTGLRYQILKQGSGAKALAEKLVTINYTVSFLTGKVCYSSKLDGPKSFRISRSTVESGLNEGILLLRVGDHAKFILPSHLAFGATGDHDQIPPRAVLVYDVEILEIK